MRTPSYAHPKTPISVVDPDAEVRCRPFMEDVDRYRTELTKALAKAAQAPSAAERQAWERIAAGWKSLLSNREAEERKRSGAD
jgi:hypothetical protein